jgi:energy-converting hydrogenase Eha subunit A
MALYANWVHGNAVRPEWIHDNLQNVSGQTWEGNNAAVPWTDVNGLPRGWGTTYRGKRALVSGFGGSLTTGPYDVNNPFRYSQKGYWFHVPIPTPVIDNGRRASLIRVFTLYNATPGVSLAAVHVYDGVNKIAALAPAFPRPASLPTGARGLIDIQEGVNRFTLPAPRQVFWGIGISLAVTFVNDGDITFFTAGADFDI